MKRLLAIGGVSLLLFSAAATPAAALTPAYTISGTYKSSTYHKNLLAVTKTGDAAFDTVAAAMSQLNYHEGNSTADFNGANSSGSKNYTEYNRAIGTVGGSYSYAWCAAFASWCLDVAGARNSAGGRFTSCTLWVDTLQDLGLYSTRSSGYTPKAGDLIFFRSAGVTRASDHVGIVRYVKGGRVYTIEGNSSNKVALHDYALTDTYIVGYGKPDYEGAALGKTALAMEDNTPGLYTVTYDFLNVRASASASSTKLGTLSCGALVKVSAIKNGWGTITYNGKTAYISLDYADFTSPLIYTVSYTASDAENIPSAREYFSFESAAADAAPAKEGYLFVGWRDAAGNLYAVGDTLPRGDLALTAEFEAIPVEEEPPETEEEEQEEESMQPDGSEEDITPETGTENAPSDEEDAEEDIPTPDDGEAARRREASRNAGVISGVLSAALGLWWYIKRFLI